MSRAKLPLGVPADNTTRTTQSYQAPDMATPRFTHAAGKKTSGFDARAGHITGEERDETAEQDDRQDHGPLLKILPMGNGVAVMVAVAALLAALAAIMIANTARVTPLCSTQPEWNQYNCRAG